MFTFRGTTKLRTRLRIVASLDERPATTRLGDWYGNLLYFGRRQLVLCTSQRSLLSVVLPARGLGITLLSDLRQGLGTVLERIGVERAAVLRELGEMDSMRHGKAVDRRVLGSMNDFALGLDYRLYAEPDEALVDLALDLAETPCSPLGFESPIDVARRLLRAGASEQALGADETRRVL